jgi:SAM-dependent methyltransferase
MPLPDTVRSLGRSLIDMREWLFDRWHSIETRGSVESPQVDQSHVESAAHGTRYEAARLYVLRRIIRECVKSGAMPRTFVDIGCGKGRACFFAATTGRFARVIGVELSSPLVEIARRNLERFRGSAAMEFICEDATRYLIPTEQSLVFLNNPFDAGILRKFLENNNERFAQGRTLVGYSHDFHRATVLSNRFELLFRDQALNLSLYRASQSEAAQE